MSNRRISLALLCLLPVACGERRDIDPSQHLGQNCRAANPDIITIDWPATDRAALESAFDRGPVAVRRTGCQTEIIDDCRIPSSYDYSSVDRKTDIIRLFGAKDVSVFLPLRAGQLVAKYGSEEIYNIALTVVGNHQLQKSHFKMDELPASCKSATHIITRAQVGAFSMWHGEMTESEVRFKALGLLGIGTSESSGETLIARDGQAGACYDKEHHTPLPGCRSLVRLQLTGIEFPSPPLQSSNRRARSNQPQNSAGDTRRRLGPGNWTWVVRLSSDSNIEGALAKAERVMAKGGAPRIVKKGRYFCVIVDGGSTQAAASLRSESAGGYIGEGSKLHELDDWCPDIDWYDDHGKCNG